MKIIDLPANVDQQYESINKRLRELLEKVYPFSDHALYSIMQTWDDLGHLEQNEVNSEDFLKGVKYTRSQIYITLLQVYENLQQKHNNQDELFE